MQMASAQLRRPANDEGSRPQPAQVAMNFPPFTLTYFENSYCVEWSHITGATGTTAWIALASLHCWNGYIMVLLIPQRETGKTRKFPVVNEPISLRIVALHWIRTSFETAQVPRLRSNYEIIGAPRFLFLSHVHSLVRTVPSDTAVSVAVKCQLVLHASFFMMWLPVFCDLVPLASGSADRECRILIKMLTSRWFR